MGLDAMALHKLAQRLRGYHLPLLPQVVRKLNFILHSSYIPLEAEIGEGTTFGYGGIGCVIHKDAKIGKHCLISQQVTLGGRSGLPGAPAIGDYVRIGAGAKILGAVKVGDFAQIGANAVVLKDVPRGAVVAGVPARELRIEADPVAAWEREMGRPPPDLATPEPASPDTVH